MTGLNRTSRKSNSVVKRLREEDREEVSATSAFQIQEEFTKRIAITVLFVTDYETGNLLTQNLLVL